MKIKLIAVAACLMFATPASGEVRSGESGSTATELEQARGELAALNSGQSTRGATSEVQLSSVFDTQAGAAALTELPEDQYVSLRGRLTKCSHTKNAAARGGTWARVPAYEAYSTPRTACLLKRGHRSGPDPVYMLQRALRWCYSEDVRETGNFGYETERALKNVQRKLGLVVDGHYGPKTRSRMEWPTYKHDGFCQRLL